jgi:probable O-glycosylation ligase (exosortase A-associated)
MTIPLMRFLQTQLVTHRGKLLMTFCMGSMAAAAMGSHSRGALLALASMGLVLWWRGKNKGMGAILMIVIAGGLLALMPAEWWSRMNTIKTYEQDQSAMGRINAWWMAFNLAKDNFFGGGFSVASPLLFSRYAPDPSDIHAAHSIYFMVLGEQGFIGLFIFLLLFGFVWASGGWLRKQGRKQGETMWVSELGNMCQVSLIGYAVGGAFLSLSYWDLPYNILILVVLGRRWLERKKWLTEPDESVLKLPPWLEKWFHKKKPGMVAAP